MEYVPFGKLASSAWTTNSVDFHNQPSATIPVWVIRNGLDDTNGAVHYSVVPAGGVAAQNYGLYEDNNPIPITVPTPNTLTGLAGDLGRALNYLNTESVAPVAEYGTYTVLLAVNETAVGGITLGGGATSTGIYGNINHSGINVLTPNNVPLDGLGTITLKDGNTFKSPPLYRIALSRTLGGATLDAVNGYSFTVAGTSVALSVTVSNTGDQPTGVLTAALTGISPSSFTVTPSGSGAINNIDIHGTRNFTVIYNSGVGAGTKATVTVTGGNGINASFDITR
jgi:hypothetical protein